MTSPDLAPCTCSLPGNPFYTTGSGHTLKCPRHLVWARSGGPDPAAPPSSARPLTSDPITHLVLTLCARTEDITRDRTSPDAPWRLKLRGERITDQRALGNIEIALTALEAAGLVQWYGYYPHQAFQRQYPMETSTGAVTLNDWDADILAGGES